VYLVKQDHLGSGAFCVILLKGCLNNSLFINRLGLRIIKEILYLEKLKRIVIAGMK
jgi:hypothetical protein